MATITGLKRITTLGKGLVNLSSTLVANGETGHETKAICALTVGVLGVTAYYGRKWLLPETQKLREIIGGSQEDPRIEDTMVEHQPDESLIAAPVKRRVRKGHKTSFMREVLACCKNRFGTPLNTAANHRIVRRFMLDYMKSHDVRDAAIREHLPNLVAAMFVPDKYEIEAMRMANCPLAYSRKVEYGLLQSALNMTTQ